jgi:hypothetical protein
LIAARDTRERMSAAAHERARNLPDWKATIHRFRDALRETAPLEEPRQRFQVDVP